MSELAIHLYTAVDSWKTTYQPLEIPKEIYLATMAAFARFLKERMEAVSQIKFDRGFWTWRYL